MNSNLKNINPTQAIQFFHIARYAALVFSSILLTKSSLTQEAIGKYETFILMSGTLSFFWVNGFMQTFLSLFNKYENKKSIITTSVLIVTGFSLLMIFLLFLLKQPILLLFSFESEHNLFLIFILYFLLNNITFIADYILLAKGKSKTLLGLGIYHFIFQTLLIAAPAYLYNDYTMVINGLLIFIIIKFIFTAVLVIKNIDFSFDRTLTATFLKTSSPLIISFFLGGMAIYADGIIVNNFFDKATFAMYQYGAREFPLSLLLANAFSAAMALQVSKNISNVALVKSGSLKLMQQLFPVCIILLIVSQWAYPIVFNSGFKESYIYFNIYLLLLIPRLVFPHSILLGLGKTKQILYASLVEFIVNISLSLALLPYFGLQGIAYATVIAFILNKLMLAYSLNKNGISINKYIPIKQLSLYSIILVLVFIVFTYYI